MERHCIFVFFPFSAISVGLGLFYLHSTRSSEFFQWKCFFKKFSFFSQFEQKLFRIGFSIYILRVQENKFSERVFEEFQKLSWVFEFWSKLVLVGLVEVSASKFSGTISAKKLQNIKKNVGVSLCWPKNFKQLLPSSHSTCQQEHFVQERSCRRVFGSTLLLIWARVLLLVLLELHLTHPEVNWIWEKRVQKKLPANPHICMSFPTLSKNYSTGLVISAFSLSN